MPDSVGTRGMQTTRMLHCDQGHESRKHTRDVGMSKRIVDSITFTAASARIAGSNGDFASFVVNDQILVAGSNLNDGYKTVTGLDVTNQAYLTVDPAPKDEGPVSNVEVRTA